MLDQSGVGAGELSEGAVGEGLREGGGTGRVDEDVVLAGEHEGGLLDGSQLRGGVVGQEGLRLTGVGVVVGGMRVVGAALDGLAAKGVVSQELEMCRARAR